MKGHVFFFATAVWYTRGKENAARHRCEERIILRLLEMTWPIFGRSGLNVTTNGILWDSFLMGVWIRRTFSVASLTRRCLYPLFIRCAVNAPEVYWSTYLLNKFFRVERPHERLALRNLRNEVKPWSQDWLIAAGAYPGFCSMKRLVSLLPLDGMLVHRRSLPCNSLGFPQQFTSTHLYTRVERGTRTQHNLPGQGSNPNRSLRSGAH